MFCIVGATATGKSGLALALARRRPKVEIVTVDSMQVYRGMDIGTAKPTAEEQDEVPHHLIDVVGPADDYTLSRYQVDANAVIEEVVGRGNVPVMVGGTGLYLRSVVDALRIPGQYPDTRAALEARSTEALYAELAESDPVAAGRMEPTNRRRIVRALEVTVGSGEPFSSFGSGLEEYPATSWTVIALDMARPVIDARIEARYAAQMEAGFLEEVQTLLEDPAGLSKTAAQALGYKELALHLEGEASIDEALDLAIRRTRRFARRQERWFKRDPRIHWLPVDEKPLGAMDELLRHYDRACAVRNEDPCN